MNRLRAMRGYLCGAMDRATDGGIGWRKKVGAWLRDRGVIVLDPTNKPIDIGVEDMERRDIRHELKMKGDFDGIASDLRIIRCVDLRMVDLSDFIIVNIDTALHACGTYEELTLANRQKKPIILRCEQGKAGVPDWLFGTIPHQMMFSTWREVYKYLDYINVSPEVETRRRWMFFNYDVPQKAIK
jgi:hypothetical protein